MCTKREFGWAIFTIANSNIYYTVSLFLSSLKEDPLVLNRLRYRILCEKETSKTSRTKKKPKTNAQNKHRFKLTTFYLTTITYGVFRT